MPCSPATENEIEIIRKVLKQAKSVSYSGNFLDGFPCKSIKWFECDLKGTDLGELYLFWDGKAWGRNGNVLPRTLRAGVKDFKQIADNPNRENPDHLQKVLDFMEQDNMAGNSLRGNGEIPILVSVDKDHPLLILDGNHRLVTYWWKNSKIDRNFRDKIFWIGFSQDMEDYFYYKRIPQSSSR